MPRLTKIRVEVFNLAKPEHKEKYEALLNSPKISHIKKEEFQYSKKTEHPIITIWYEEFI
jgi:hypothetical protein